MTTILITGAGSGIGKAIAERIVAEGGCAVIADLNLENAKAVAESLGRDNAVAVHIDVTSEAAIQQALAEALKRNETLTGELRITRTERDLLKEQLNKPVQIDPAAFNKVLADLGRSRMVERRVAHAVLALVQVGRFHIAVNHSN